VGTAHVPSIPASCSAILYRPCCTSACQLHSSDRKLWHTGVAGEAKKKEAAAATAAETRLQAAQVRRARERGGDVGHRTTPFATHVSDEGSVCWWSVDDTTDPPASPTAVETDGYLKPGLTCTRKTGTGHAMRKVHVANIQRRFGCRCVRNIVSCCGKPLRCRPFAVALRPRAIDGYFRYKSMQASSHMAGCQWDALDARCAVAQEGACPTGNGTAQRPYCPGLSSQLHNDTSSMGGAWKWTARHAMCSPSVALLVPLFVSCWCVRCSVGRPSLRGGSGKRGHPVT
jgi:hypothetical protein